MGNLPYFQGVECFSYTYSTQNELTNHTRCGVISGLDAIRSILLCFYVQKTEITYRMCLESTNVPS